MYTQYTWYIYTIYNLKHKNHIYPIKQHHKFSQRKSHIKDTTSWSWSSGYEFGCGSSDWKKKDEYLLVTKFNI